MEIIDMMLSCLKFQGIWAADTITREKSNTLNTLLESVGNCRGSWVLGKGRGSWVVVVGKCRG